MSTFETTRNELRKSKKSCAENPNYIQFLACVRCDAMLHAKCFSKVRWDKKHLTINKE